MTGEKFLELIRTVVEKCVVLKDKYVQENDIVIDYVCLFSHSPEEYQEFLTHASHLGTVASETETGPVFAFNTPPSTSAGKPKVLKIRKPDLARPQMGYVDFTTDYQSFKKKYLGRQGFSLIQRKEFEMMELRDKAFNVLVYFSSIPQSALLGAT